MLDLVEFDECGLHFEVQGPLDERDAMILLVRWPDGRDRTVGCTGMREVGERVDAFVAELPDERRTGAFAGIELDVWDPATHRVETWSYSTRGRLLEWFDTGKVPTLEEAVELAEFPGGKVLVIRDGSGRTLRDLRARLVPADDGAERPAMLN